VERLIEEGFVEEQKQHALIMDLKRMIAARDAG